MTENRCEIALITSADYRSLLGEAAWRRLHPDIQLRFALGNVGKRVIYRGVMQLIFLSLPGRLLAQICRLIGTPLALYDGVGVPVTVEVYHDVKMNGMTWDRYYHYPGRRLNRVKSTKCIRPGEGLEEVVGGGFGMHLAVYEQDRAIVFESTRFFWQWGKRKITIPALLTPGKTIVRQQALAGGKFRFELEVEHPWLGRVFYQNGTFRAD